MMTPAERIEIYEAQCATARKLFEMVPEEKRAEAEDLLQDLLHAAIMHSDCMTTLMQIQTIMARGGGLLTHNLQQVRDRAKGLPMLNTGGKANG